MKIGYWSFEELDKTGMSIRPYVLFEGGGDASQSEHAERDGIGQHWRQEQLLR